MDRLGSTAPAAAVEFDPEPEGWDAYAVWQTRVHDARHAAPSARPRPKAAEASEGWDPLQTWRMRVHRVRNDR